MFYGSMSSMSACACVTRPACIRTCGAMKRHILFVDDEAPIRELLSLYFRKQGYEVTTAVTGPEAIEKAKTAAFSAAILDVKLYGESGLDLLELFKREYPRLPVIMFTGVTGDDTLLDKAMVRGADGFMRKTESLDTLFAEVQRHEARP
jgi:DNA-binding response OmpR family regulator